MAHGYPGSYAKPDGYIRCLSLLLINVPNVDTKTTQTGYGNINWPFNSYSLEVV
jgi:hypothetical protein